MPSIVDIENQFKIQKIANKRLDIGQVLKEFSYTKDNLFLTSLDIKDRKLSISGIVLAPYRESKRLLKPLMNALKMADFEDIKVVSVKEDPKNIQRLIFTIEANEEALPSNENRFKKNRHK